MKRPSRGNDRRSAGRSENNRGYEKRSSRSSSSEGGSYGRSNDRDKKFSKRNDNDRGEKKSYGRSSESSDRKFSKRSDDNRGEKRSYGRSSEGGDRKFSKRRDDDRGEKRSYSRSSEGGERSYSKRRDDDRGEKRSYSRSSEGGERKFSKRRDDARGEKRSYSRSSEGGDRKFSKRRDDDRGEKRSYGRSTEGGERKYGKRDDERSGTRKFDDRKKKSFGRSDVSESRGYKKREEDDFENKSETSGEESYGTSKKRKSGFSGFSGKSDKKSYINEDFKDDEEFDFKKLDDEKKRVKKSSSDYKKLVQTSRSKKSTVKREDDGSIRLNKFIANTGVCSRREADELIQSGVVKVNGKIVTELGTRVMPTDKVHYGDQLLSQEKLVYVLLNKPKDYITTVDDPEKRRTVMELVEKATKERIYPVGRLDRNTTGLLLFTNDGELTDKLTHPRNNIKKIYHVMTDQNVSREDLLKLKEGFELEDGFIKVDDVQFVGDASNKRDIGVEIHSGRNRIVRRMFEHLGYKVIKLDRVMFAGLVKKDLPRGKWRFLTPKEVSFLKMI